MTVQELSERLRGHDPSATVVVPSSQGWDDLNVVSAHRDLTTGDALFAQAFREITKQYGGEPRRARRRIARAKAHREWQDRANSLIQVVGRMPSSGEVS